MNRNPKHWRDHCHQLADTLNHTSRHWQHAIHQIVDMLPGLTGNPINAPGSNSGGTSSIVERLALAISPERTQHQELVELPAIIHDHTRRLTRLDTAPQTTNHGRIKLAELHLTWLATHGRKPHPKQLEHLTNQIWRLDQLVTLWAVGEDRQRDLRKEAGGPATSNDEIWCTNCRQHGHNTPRHQSGVLFCKWCHEFKTEWHILPDGPLLDAHHRRRITSTDIDRALKRQGSRRRVVA